ncbi:hypothetical protein H3T52_07220 [Commensalibacter sp. M0402]|uniref:hypothetical protein n=1 Tax=Commensalibacter TaxID=1079922 RepID=UPI0018DE7954|nr:MULTISPECIES: hypothetical protein [Commensalibacter]MBI0083671.1 hypothetical protein [Commensalibacter sp. W6292M3]MBI0088734.1 hypothetical protein [Commensalibacter melissae]
MTRAKNNNFDNKEIKSSLKYYLPSLDFNHSEYEKENLQFYSLDQDNAEIDESIDLSKFKFNDCNAADDYMDKFLDDAIDINAQSIFVYDNTKEHNLDYIIIGCRIPNGLVIKVDGQNILLRGIRDMPGKDSRRFFGNIGFTRLPRDLWNEFLKCHSKWSPLVNGSVFIASYQDDCSDA